MNKERTIELAHYYYALAIINHFMNENSSDEASPFEIREVFSGNYHDGDPYSLLENNVLFDKGLKWLVDQKLVALIEDDFGPPIILCHPDFHLNWTNYLLESSDSLPFSRYARIANGTSWLRSALHNLASAISQLKLSDDDFLRPEDAWEPIALEHDDPALKNVLTKLDETVEQVRGANGYAATALEEQKYVLVNLQAASERLRTDDTTSKSFLRSFVTEPLLTISRRFGNAVLGALAQALLADIKAWLARYGIDL